MKPTTEEIVLKLLKNIYVSKAAGIDILIGSFLKDGTVTLAKPVIEIESFPDPCKLVKLKPMFKKGQEWTPPVTDLFCYYLWFQRYLKKLCMTKWLTI